MFEIRLPKPNGKSFPEKLAIRAAKEESAAEKHLKTRRALRLLYLAAMLSNVQTILPMPKLEQSLSQNRPEPQENALQTTDQTQEQIINCVRIAYIIASLVATLTRIKLIGRLKNMQAKNKQKALDILKERFGLEAGQDINTKDFIGKFIDGFLVELRLPEDQQIGLNALAVFLSQGQKRELKSLLKDEINLLEFKVNRSGIDQYLQSLDSNKPTTMWLLRIKKNPEIAFSRESTGKIWENVKSQSFLAKVCQVRFDQNVCNDFAWKFASPLNHTKNLCTDLD